MDLCFFFCYSICYNIAQCHMYMYMCLCVFLIEFCYMLVISEGGLEWLDSLGAARCRYISTHFHPIAVLTTPIFFNSRIVGCGFV